MAYKYNPGFLSDADIIERFVVRIKDLALLKEILEDNVTSPANRHLLVVGPRGSGKTTLARRLVAEIRTNNALSVNWYPIVLGEESYTISNAGEFWLECVFHLAEQERQNHDLQEQYKKVQKEENDVRLRELALGILITFAKKAKKKILLVVENLNMILEDQMDAHEAWAIRHALQNVPEIMLFATATKKFDHIQSLDKALFEQFKVHELRPLTVPEIAILWSNFTKERLRNSRARPIQILTGGSPRLITILAEFALDHSLINLMGKLTALIDQYTDYFKSQLDSLAPGERKVFVAVLEKWDPATSKEVASEARVTVKTASALLDRLKKRGAVQRRAAGGIQYWEASERLFNLYYLMRRRGAPSSRVYALVRFMTVYYEKDQLLERAKDLAVECGQLEPQLRDDHYSALDQIIRRFDRTTRERLLTHTPPDVAKKLSKQFEDEQSSDEILWTEILKLLNERELDRAVERIEREDARKEIADLVGLVGFAVAMQHPTMKDKGSQLLDRAELLDPKESALPFYRAAIEYRDDKLPEALSNITKAIALKDDVAHYWKERGDIEKDLGNFPDAEKAFRKATQLDPESASNWYALGRLLFARVKDLNFAEEALRRAHELKPKKIDYAGELADFLIEEKKDYNEAESLYRKIIDEHPTDPRAWESVIKVLVYKHEAVEKIQKEFERALAVDGLSNAWRVYASFARAMNAVHQHEKALEVMRSAVAALPESGDAWHHLARILPDLPEHEEEKLAAFEKAIKLAPKDSQIWTSFGEYLSELALRQDEAEAALRNATELSPYQCETWRALADHLLRNERGAEAKQCYEKALKLNSQCKCSVSGYTRVLTMEKKFAKVETFLQSFSEGMPTSPEPHIVRSKYLTGVLKDYAGAIEQIHTALKKGASPFNLVSPLLSAIDPKDPKSSIAEIQRFVEETKAGDPLLNILAWRMLRKKVTSDLLTYAVQLAEGIVERHGDVWDYRDTLANLYVAARQVDDALHEVDWLAENLPSNQLEAFIDLSVKLAKSGATPTLLQLLRKSRSNALIEPLIVALQLELGEEPAVAKEIIEVAKDIQEQIRGNSD